MEKQGAGFIHKKSDVECKEMTSVFDEDLIVSDTKKSREKLCSAFSNALKWLHETTPIFLNH